METVIVTGGLGRSGTWVVDRLAEAYEVVCVDLSQPGFEVQQRDNVDFRAADLTDRGAVLDLVADVDPDAVVHWAAIPAPGRHPGGEVFETNVLSTYNVLVAAGRADARVVWASSESSYGFPFAEDDRFPDSLPVTVDHAQRPEDPYGTSKVVGEEVAEMVVRRYDVSVISVRPSWIQYPGEYHCRDRDDLASDDPNPAEMDLAAGVGNFWSYVDVRDVAGLVAAALENPPAGHEAVHAVASENYLDVPSEAAVREYFGAVPEECTIEGDESVVSPAAGERLFDYTPQHSWREAADEDVEEPVLFEAWE